MRKKATLYLTTGKLIIFILLGIVLVALIFGIRNGMLPPINKISSKFDSLLVMLHVKEDMSSPNCYPPQKVAILNGGSDLLKALGVSNKDIYLNVCSDRTCNFSGGLEDYRNYKGKFQKFNSAKVWAVYPVFKGDLAEIKFNWELYNGGIDLLNEIGAKKIYEDRFTSQFILFGDGGMLYKDVSAVWENNKWMVVEGKLPDNWEKDGWRIEGDRLVLKGWAGELSKPTGVSLLYNGGNDSLAIDAFVSSVRGRLNDKKVYYKELGPVIPDREYVSSNTDHGKEIGDLIWNVGAFSSWDEIDSDWEVNRLKMEFSKIKKRFLDKSVISDSEFEDFKNKLSGKKKNIGGKIFVVDVERVDGLPVVSFFSGKDKFALIFDSKPSMNSGILKNVKLRYFPVSLVKGKTSMSGISYSTFGNQEYYRLPKKNFDEIYNATLVSDFLGTNCR